MEPIWRQHEPFIDQMTTLLAQQENSIKPGSATETATTSEVNTNAKKHFETFTARYFNYTRLLETTVQERIKGLWVDDDKTAESLKAAMDAVRSCALQLPMYSQMRGSQHDDPWPGANIHRLP